MKKTISLLTRGLSPCASNLTGMSIQAISNVRRRLLQRVFHQSEGGSKEFDRLIMKL